MTGEDINYDALLWSLPYQREALERAAALTHTHRDLANLYEFIFDPQTVHLPVIPVSIPYLRQVEDCKAESTHFFGHRPQLPLSIVTITRNDEHVERMAERTQAFIDCLYYLAEKYQREIELIIVEWNPPADRKTVSEAFTFPECHPYVSTEIVTVPRELHQTYQLAEQLPLYQMIGKNVGIRRARGEFILSTNIDVLLSEQLFDYISSGQLSPGRFYRGNRWDVDRKILDLKSPKAMIDNAPELTFQINYPHATLPVNETPAQQSAPQHDITYRRLPPVHTMACGDFQLLHRDDWAKMRGFCELDTFSFHIDSLFGVTCYHANIEEIDLGNSLPHYHIDHTLGTSVKNDSYVIDSTKVMKHISIAGLTNLSRNMEEKRDFFIFNKANWGMAGIDLPIKNVTIADWEQEAYQPSAPLMDSSKGCIDGIDLSTVNIDQQQMQNKHEMVHAIVNATANYLRRYVDEKTFHIWGTGYRAKVLSQFLTAENIRIEGFVDTANNPLPPRDCDTNSSGSTTTEEEKPYFFLVSSMYASDIVQQLTDRNLIEGEDYLVSY